MFGVFFLIGKFLIHRCERLSEIADDRRSFLKMLFKGVILIKSSECLLLMYLFMSHSTTRVPLDLFVCSGKFLHAENTRL